VHMTPYFLFTQHIGKICVLFFLTSASSFYLSSLLRTSTRSECSHIKHAPLRVSTSQLDILVCYKSLPWTAYNYETYWADEIAGWLETAHWTNFGKWTVSSAGNTATAAYANH